MPARGRTPRLSAWLAWRLAPAALLALAWGLFGARVAAVVLALLPALACAAFAWGFARTLRPGREPLIARYIRFDERRDDAECAAYAGRLTALWAVALGLAAVLQLVPLAAPWAGGAAAWHLLPLVALLLLFLGEHVVRSLCFPAGGIAWPAQTFRAILRAERARHG